MPEFRKRKGRPPTVQKFLEDNAIQLELLAAEGCTDGEIGRCLGGAHRNTVGKVRRKLEIKRNRDVDSRMAENQTADNVRIVWEVREKWVKHYKIRFGLLANLRLDLLNGRRGRFKGNPLGISCGDIEDQANLITAKILKAYDAGNKSIASLKTYANSAFAMGMNDLVRAAYAQAKFLNVSSYSGSDDGPADEISGNEMGIENLVAVDENGETFISGSSRFAEAVRQAAWVDSPHKTDKRIFYSSGCPDRPTFFSPQHIAKPIWSDESDYGCPYCWEQDAEFTGMSVAGRFIGTKKEKEARAKWDLLCRPYNKTERAPNTPPTISLKSGGPS